MPTRVGRRRRVARHIAVAVQPILHRISAGELACHRIVVPRVVVVQPRRAIRPLPRVTETRGLGAAAIADCAIRRVELRRGHVAAAIQRLADRPLSIRRQIGERAIRADTLSSR